MYVVGRGDLAPGPRATQAIHAAFQFSAEHPETVKRWYPSNLVVLEAPDEDAILALQAECWDRKLKCSLVQEPDYGDQYTALAIQPSEATEKLCASLPLMLKERKMAA